MNWLGGDINNLLSKTVLKTFAQLGHVDFHLRVVLDIRPELYQLILDYLALIDPHSADTSGFEGSAAEASSKFDLDFDDIFGRDGLAVRKFERQQYEITRVAHS